MTTLRERLLQSPATPAGELVIPELDGLKIYLRRWTLGDEIALREIQESPENGPVKLAKFVRLCVATEDNQPVFADWGDCALCFPADAAERILNATIAANRGATDPKANLPATTS